MNLAPFAITPPETASAHIRAMVKAGALLVPASILQFKTDPGSANLCPVCFTEFGLQPVFNTEGYAIIGFICSYGHVFDNSQALKLVFGHLTV